VGGAGVGQNGGVGGGHANGGGPPERAVASSDARSNGDGPAPMQQKVMHGRVNQQNDDPLRHPVIHALAASVPFSKRTVSKLVCPVTAIVMEGNNQPVVLPNGYVYGSLAVYEGLLDWNGDGDGGVGRDGHGGEDSRSRAARTHRAQNALAEAGGAPSASEPAKKIQCPCTGDIFSVDQVRRLYIV
jgi:hypothetical protein